MTDGYPIPCPRCKVAAGERCVSASGTRTDTHRVRINHQFDPIRLVTIQMALASVYCRPTDDHCGYGTMVESCAENIHKRMDDLVAKAEDNGHGLEHEIMLVIWMWFAGGSTAEIAASKVLEAITV